MVGAANKNLTISSNEGMTNQKEERHDRQKHLESDFPCMCGTCYSARDKELSRLRNSILTELTEWDNGQRVEQCNCEDDDGIGYHTKECDMVALGINKQVDVLLTHLQSLKKNL